MKLSHVFVSALLFCVTMSAYAQTNTLVIGPNIRLPKDSILSKQLITSLKSFLTTKEKPNIENTSIFGKDVLKTYVLLDEMNGMGKSEKYKDNDFYKPYLTNLIQLDDSTWMTQLSYVGIAESNPLLRASFKLIAHKSYTGFLFSSPLEKNTAHWSTQKLGYCTFHAKYPIDKDKIAVYEKAVVAFDKKLNVTRTQFETYICDNLPDALNMIGVEYKSDYNGRLNSRLSSQTENRSLVVDGLSYENGVFDPHDLWHDRMFMVVDRAKYNKVFDEGCAHLYGGSWGLTWDEIWKMFSERVSNDKNKNWLDEFGKFTNFGDSPQKHLRPEYIISALIVKKVEKEQGFAKVLELIASGPYEKSNENYFKTLEKVTGITKATFNEKVWELINKENL